MTALLRDGARRVVVASYLLAPGLFADRIATAARAAGAAVVSAPLGAAPEVADVLLDRYTEAGRWRDRALQFLSGNCGFPALCRWWPRVIVAT